MNSQRQSHYDIPIHTHTPTKCLIYDLPRHCLIMTAHPAQPTPLNTVSHQDPLDSVSL